MTKFALDCKEALEYSDVFLVPNFSDVLHRKEIDISSTMNGRRISCPVISSNMIDVTNAKMCVAIQKAGGLGALHRFHGAVEKTRKEFEEVYAVFRESTPILVSVGTTGNAHELAHSLYHANARYFIVDIAHGYSEQMRKMVQYLKKTYKDVYIVAGNVATFEGAYKLFEWGADAVKVGISSGSICVTKNITGFTVPMFSALLNCVRAAKVWESCSGKRATIIADGGFREIGDICKALGAGADFIMSGRFFAGCNQAPNPKVYRGSASWEVQLKYRKETDMPVPEGVVDTVQIVGPVEKVIEDISSGIRSSFSYCNAKNLQEFHEKARFGTRHAKNNQV